MPSPTRMGPAVDVSDLSPLALSLLVSSAATLLVLPAGTAIAWWLAYSRPFPGKILIETFLTLPLVLPPTVVGYGLLVLVGRRSAFGVWLSETAGIRLIFTWQGAAIAAAVMAAPLFIRT